MKATFILLYACFIVVANSIDEGAILDEFFHETGGPQWLVRTGWLDDKTDDYCEYFGVTCEAKQVVAIVLPNNKLIRSIPSSLYSLPALRLLTLRSNSLEEAGFEGLTSSSGLQEVDLSETLIRSIDGVSSAKNLRVLQLSQNANASPSIAGSPFPEEVTKLPNLRMLHLQSNRYTGTLPSTIQELSLLSELYLSSNELSGSVPSEVGKLLQLRILSLSDNLWTGTIPDTFRNLINLEVLNLKGKGNSVRSSTMQGRLSGKLPAFDEQRHLKQLFLSNNAFTGAIPENFLKNNVNTDGSQPVTVSLGFNSLTGLVPETLVRFEAMNLEITGNEFTGPLSNSFCTRSAWMDGLVAKFGCDAILCAPRSYSPTGQQLTKQARCEPCHTIPSSDLRLGATACEGSIETVEIIGLNSNPEVEILDLIFQRTGGPDWTAEHTNWTKPGIPICYREGVLCGYKPPDMNSGVTELRFNRYGLKGQIPTDVFKLPKIRRIAASFNNVDMSFEGIEQAEILQIISLSHTDVKSLKGIEKAGKVLYDLDIGNSRLKGGFPSEVLLSSLKSLRLESNELSGPLPSELGSMKHLTVINVSGNKLSGSIPTELGGLSDLQMLDLSSQRSTNRLEGPLLPFSTNPSLHQLNLGGNSLTGTVPATLLSAVDKTAVVHVDLSYNRLSGAFPITLQSFKTLNIDLAANKIDELPKEVCANSDWMKGITGLVSSDQKCDTILCQPGTFALKGKQGHIDEPCKKCSHLEEAPFYGSVGCLDPMTMHERKVLMAFGQGLNVGNWHASENWLSDRHVCTWAGVRCRNFYIDKLDLRDNGLKQTEQGFNALELLTSLSNLKDINLDGNDITIDFGSIQISSPLEALSISNTRLKSLEGIGRAKKLKRLVANHNSLINIPKEMFGLPMLRHLDLSFNKLHGPVPTAFFDMQTLEELQISNNDFTGALPRNIGSSPNLRELIVTENYLSGSIPSEINEVSTLEKLALNQQKGSKIEGRLPDFATSTKLWFIDISNNQISNSLPNNILAGSEVTSEQVIISLENNKISGSIPATLSRFSNLDLRLANNRIEEIPVELCSREDWLSKSVGIVGSCDAILCPQGFYASAGRQVSLESPCLRCESLVVSPFLGQTTCNDISERQILQNLFLNAGGSSWINKDRWNTQAPVCTWYGIECDASDADGGVTALKLKNNHMAGDFSIDLFMLPLLVEVDVSGNSEIHVSLEALSQELPFLETLNLANTKTRSLNGISYASNLRNLAISGISGPFPDELFRLDRLEFLQLSNCFLVGTIPTRVGELTKLKTLIAPFNDFHGSLPKEIGQLSSLEVLDLSENLLSGALPNIDISSLPKLKRFAISRATKSGRKLSGSLPELNNAPALTSLRLDGNNFNGSVPVSLLSRIEIDLVLANNNLVGFPEQKVSRDAVDERSILVELYSTCGGKSWSRSDFWLTRVSYCDWFGVGCRKGHVVMVNLQSNNVSCTLPTTIWNLPWLQLLWLSSNPSAELMFENIGNSNLLDLKLDNTALKSLSGIGLAKSLTSLDVSSNGLSGRFPAEIFELKNLRVLSLSNNAFDGELPSSLASLPYLRVLEAENNTFSGSLPSLDSSVALTKINVGFNELKGTIPSNFLDRVPNFASVTVQIQRNQLSGKIPKELERFKTMNLDFHGNRIDTVPSVLCEQSDWNDGDVGKFGSCDALACAPGTTNRIGRQSSETPMCISCPRAANYYGQVDCGHSAAGATLGSYESNAMILSLVLVACLAPFMRLL